MKIAVLGKRKVGGALKSGLEIMGHAVKYRQSSVCSPRCGGIE